MHFIPTSTVAIALASFANAAPISSIPGVADLQAWKTILSDPNVNQTEYGLSSSEQIPRYKQGCHTACSSVIQLIAKKGCDSGWEEYEKSCETCFYNRFINGDDIKEKWENGLAKAVSMCRIDQVPDQQEVDGCPTEKPAAEKGDAEKLAAEKLDAEKLAAEKLDAEKLAAEKLDAEKLAAEKLDAEKLDAGQSNAESKGAEVGDSMGLQKNVNVHDCHAACGGIITRGREGNCKVLKESLVPLCEKCAIQTGIWGIYKCGAQAAAAKCDLKVNPQ